MFSRSLLALAPVAAHAAQSAQWPAFVLRANVTQQYQGYGPAHVDRREFWHNAPISQVNQGDITGPLFEESTCGAPPRAGLNDHGPYFSPEFFYLNATATGAYAPSALVAGSSGRPDRIQIAQKDQADSLGRRPVVVNDCDTPSTSLYISQDEPYHLVYDNKAADEKFGSFYMCGGSLEDGYYSYGDGIFYRSADEETPESCGEVTFFPECMPLEYTVTTTQGTSNDTIPYDLPGAYNATCYVDVEAVTGPPNTDVSTWMNAPRTNYHFIGKISVEEQPSSY